jgi:hypothetical protein
MRKSVNVVNRRPQDQFGFYSIPWWGFEIFSVDCSWVGTTHTLSTGLSDFIVGTIIASGGGPIIPHANDEGTRRCHWKTTIPPLL